MATLMRCLNWISIKFGVLDMEIWTLPTSLNKMNKLQLQWKSALWCFGFFFWSTLASMKSNLFRSLVKNGSIKLWGKNWVSSNSALINLKRYVNPYNPSPTEDCMFYSMLGDLESTLNWWRYSIPFRSIYLSSKKMI